MTRLAAPTAAVLGLLLVSSCTGGVKRPVDTPAAPPVPAGSLQLAAFDSCKSLLDGLRTAAKSSVGQYGFGGRSAPFGSVDDKAGAADGARAPMATGGEPAAHSTTNTHETGVDEPDIVKTDGTRIVTVAAGVLRVVDVATKKVAGTLRVEPGPQGSVADLLLAGDHVLVFGYGNAGPRLSLVDIAGQPRLLGQYTMDGALLDARQVGSVARVVVQTSPQLEFPSPPGDVTPEQRAEFNRGAIDRTPLEAWLPKYQIIDADGRQTDGHVDCADVRRPAEYSGTSMLTVLTFDLGANALTNGDPVTIAADGRTVYANGPSLYVASDQRWRVMWADDVRDRRAKPVPARTQIYKFDISGAGKPRYVAGGEVGGWLLNQYSLSEWDGKLRVATTEDEPWAGASSPATTVSTVTVLNGSMRRIGAVGGLGKGERIYAVRFIGTTGYVVTFRQTDPLYTLDLRDPAAPRVAGELKINGYSAYLHPAGDGRLLGIGQDATNGGRSTGFQVSLFDTRDLAHPARLANYTVSDSYSIAQYDPHAFLYWAATGTLVVPVGQRMLVLKVQSNALTLAGEVTPGDDPDGIGAKMGAQRALVIGDTLWTLGITGLQANDLGTLADRGRVTFS